MTYTPLESLLKILLLTLRPLHIEPPLPLCQSGVGPLRLLHLLLVLTATATALGMILANDNGEGLKGLFVSLSCG